jgi:5,6,7,8-tetrahydromethanopterin hydro-lyase
LQTSRGLISLWASAPSGRFGRKLLAARAHSRAASRSMLLTGAELKEINLPQSSTDGESVMSMFIGEALFGEGNEIAHIDLLIGSKDGPVGAAFANALARQSEGHSNLLAVLTPNLAVKPATVLITKVTIKGMKQAVQMFGPAQAAVAKAVADSVADGIIPAKDAENLVIVCGVFIHPGAEVDKKIYDYNYQATKDAIASAMRGKPSVQEMLAGKDKAAHPFRGF